MQEQHDTAQEKRREQADALRRQAEEQASSCVRVQWGKHDSISEDGVLQKLSAFGRIAHVVMSKGRPSGMVVFEMRSSAVGLELLNVFCFCFSVFFSPPVKSVHAEVYS